MTVVVKLYDSKTYEVTQVVRNFELAISSSSLGMHNALGDTLTVKVSEEVDQVEVLEQERSVLADTLRRLRSKILVSCSSNGKKAGDCAAIPLGLGLGSHWKWCRRVARYIEASRACR